MVKATEPEVRDFSNSFVNSTKNYKKNVSKSSIHFNRKNKLYNMKMVSVNDSKAIIMNENYNYRIIF